MSTSFRQSCRQWSVRAGLGAGAVMVAALAATATAHADTGETIPGTNIPVPTTVDGIAADESQLATQLQADMADSSTASDLSSSIQTAGSLGWMDDVTAAANSQIEAETPSVYLFSGEETGMLADQGQFQASIIDYFGSMQIPSGGETNGSLNDALQQDLNYQGDINQTVANINGDDATNQLTHLTDDNIALATFDTDLSNEASWTGDVDLLSGL